MDKIKTVKIKNEDGSISEETYTISVDAKNVDMKNGKDLQETIGTIDIDTDGNIGEQLDNLNENVSNLNIDIKKKAYFFNTVADMKADTNLKVGDMIITLGYYESNDGGGAEYKIVKTSDNFIEELNNNLKAELVIKDNIINMLSLGIKRNNISFNSTNILQNAINKSNGYILYFPYGRYYLTNINVDIGQHNIKIYGDNAFGRNNRTIFNPYTGMQGTMFTVGNPTTTIDNIVYGFEMKNLCIKTEGNQPYTMNAIALGRTSNVYFENLSIYYMDGFAISMDGVYDSIFENVEINVAGNSTTAALIMQGTVTATNAIRYNNCRLECCVRYLHIKNNVFQLMFNNTKFEDNRSSNSAENAILIEDDGDITFNSCLFTSKAGPTHYLINFGNNDYKVATRFVGCNFQCSQGNSNGGKFINTTTSGGSVSGVVITDSYFSMPSTLGAVVLNKTTFTNNIIFPHTFSESTNTHIIECVSDNIVKNNLFLGNVGSYKPFAILLTGTNNIVQENKYQIWGNEKLVGNIDSYPRNTLDFRIDEPTGTSINNGIIDATQSNIISVPANTTITKINNAWIGCELILYANGSGITLDTTQIAFLYPGALGTFTAGYCKKIKKVSATQWIVL